MSNAATLGCEPHDAGLTAVRETLADLHEQRLAWEHDVTALFDDFDSLAVQMALKSSADDQLAAKFASEDHWRELAGKNALLERHQEVTAHQLASMQAMISQQTELLTAFIGAATHFSAAASPPSEVRPNDPVLSTVRAEFAQCSSAEVDRSI